MLKIIHIPNPVLTQPTESVTVFDSSFKKIIKDMEEALATQVGPELVGVGLAAPQVAINKRFFIIKPNPEAKTQVFANAKIIDQVASNNTQEQKTDTGKKKKRPSKLEGCLSIPKLWGPVHRSKKILVEYQDENGKPKKAWFAGFKAVIIQHEIDHTDGILFTQRVLEQNNNLYEEKDGKLKKLSY